jgi:hypothetical protein
MTNRSPAMASHTARLYVAAAALLTFFVLWAAIAAHPWRATAADPRLAQLAQRQRLLRREAVLVQRIVDRRAGSVRAAAQKRRQLAAASPAVRIVTLPPLVITRSS